MPLYIAGVIDAAGHRLSSGSDYIQFNSYIIGPGVIFYPVSLLQVSVSGGYSFSKIDDNSVLTIDSESGFGGSVSAALDFGSGKSGFLVGARYFLSITTLEIVEVEHKTSMISVFVKYAYRTKN